MAFNSTYYGPAPQSYSRLIILYHIAFKPPANSAAALAGYLLMNFKFSSLTMAAVVAALAVMMSLLSWQLYQNLAQWRRAEKQLEHAQSYISRTEDILERVYALAESPRHRELKSLHRREDVQEIHAEDKQNDGDNDAERQLPRGTELEGGSDSADDPAEDKE